MIVPIHLENRKDVAYDITIDTLPHLTFDTQVAIVTNPTVSGYHLETLLAKITAPKVEVVTVPDGESFKTFETVETVLNELFEAHFDRKSLLIAFGGGVIGDMTGFTASLYQRGIDFIQIPTTLLSQVDASVGGKTGVNNKYGKNLIGAFYQPQAVYIDPSFLETLPQREFAADGPTPIRYATSGDLERWTPRGSLKGTPSGRDPQVFVCNDLYHLIVCGVHDVRLATSSDFRTWKRRGPILEMKQGVDPESPSLVRFNDTFYLFVCGWNGVWDRKDIQGAYQHKTYVYRSDDPLRFGLDDEVAVINAHAPEVFQDEAGDWFISSVEWPHRGVSIARLAWE